MTIPYVEFQREQVGIVSMVTQASLHPDLMWNDERRQQAYFLVAEFIKFMYVDELTEYADVEFLENADEIMHQNAARIEEIVMHHYGDDAEVQLRCVECFLANHFTDWMPNFPPQLPIDTRIEQANEVLDNFFIEHIRDDLSWYRRWFRRRQYVSLSE